MRIDQINLYRVLLPFSGEFAHSLRKRFFAKNIVVEVLADHGEIIGYGEGAPRSYVTGESQESAMDSIKNLIGHTAFPWELNDVSHIWGFIDSLPGGKENNSAICALEMSLLDALGKKEDRSIIDFFPQDFFTKTIKYGGGITLTSRERALADCGFFKKMKINRLKLKMGRDLGQNRDAFDAVCLTYGDDYDLKVDVNGVWDHELAMAHIPLIREYKVKVVEQPMEPDNHDIAEFAEIMRDNDVFLMADESVCSLIDLEQMIEEDYYNMVNVRLSKCGGFRRSFEIIDYLRANDVSFQIACHLGESGLLSAAGRVLSLLCRDAKYYDGSYDNFLLKDNITFEDVSFGIEGEAGPLTGSGLGVKVSSENLERLSDPLSRITIMRSA